MQSSLQDTLSLYTQEYLNGVSHLLTFTDEQIKSIVEIANTILKSEGVTFRHARDFEAAEKLIFHEKLRQILFSPSSPWTPNIDRLFLTERQQLIFSAFRGTSPSLNKLFSDEKLVPSIMTQQDEGVFSEVRELLQKIFIDIQLQLTEKPLTMESEHIHMEMIIGDFLALFPFLNPPHDSQINIPIRIGNPKQWSLISYAVETIFLTPSWMGSPVTAYGLTPVDKNNHAPPLLLFKGTTYPSDKGFGLSLLTDLNPFGSIGASVYALGKEKIQLWFEKNKDLPKAILIGKSLGGMLCDLSVIDFADQIDMVLTYGTPGFSFGDLQRFYSRFEQAVREGTHFPQIHSFCQKNDLAPFCDFSAERGIHYYQVIGSVMRHGVLAHADMYSAHVQSLILKFDPTQKSYKILRIALTALRKSISLILFPFIFYIHMICVGTKQVRNQMTKKHTAESRL